MNEREVLELLRSSGAVLEGHFLLSSGRHSDLYVEKFRLFERPKIAAALGATLAGRLRGRQIEVVLSPAVGAIVFGFAVSLALEARFVFAERDGEALVLRRGFAIGEGERVAVIEDVVTTGRSLGEVLGLVPPGELVGVGCLLDRSERSGGMELPSALTSLARLEAESWGPESCPLCAQGAPLTAPGSRHLAPGDR
ncbi:MAG: orotate phosphoribosyltransferase [Candidatus Methylomirabilales bacterium]